MAYQRKRKRRAPPLRLYEVEYTIIGGEIEHHVYRVRCRRLTPQQLRMNKPIVGEVSARIGLKPEQWTPFGAGALPGVEAYNPRIIREIAEPPLALPKPTVIEGGKK